jgi:hypothetical protein
MHVPNAQPPLPTDWEVHPTHPVLPVVPYALAQYWDRGLRQHVERRHRRGQHAGRGDDEGGVGRVPRGLRDTAKRRPAVRGWVRALEEPVRRFLEEEALEAEWEKVGESSADDNDEDGDEGEDEVVFAGRRKTTSLPIREKRRSASEDDEEVVFAGRQAAGVKKARRQVGRKEVDRGVVFEELGDDSVGAFRYGICDLDDARLANILTSLQTVAYALHLDVLRPLVSLGNSR